jgi:hypothetical protein
MEIGSIFLILALFLLVSLFIGRPLFEGQKGTVLADPPGDHERSALLAERDRVINALRELEFDHVLGKIPEEDYPGQRDLLMRRGADILRQLDEVEPGESAIELEKQIETAIAARKAETELISAAAGNGRNGSQNRFTASPVASPDDDLEALIANRRRVRLDKAAGFCPKCGGPLQKSDRFCPKCGAKTV